MFLLVSLFSRQFLRNGCLIDFTSLLECWDEHHKTKLEEVKKDLKLKKQSIKTTDRVKQFTTHDTVCEDEEGKDEIENSMDMDLVSGSDEVTG